MEDVFSVLKRLGASKITQTITEDPHFTQGGVPSTRPPLDPFQLFPRPELKATVLAPRKVEHATTSTDEVHSPFIRGKTFFHIIMHIMNPMVSVLNDQSHALEHFKQELSKNLTNESQLFKKFGFSRRKGLTAEDMQAEIMKTSSSAIPSENIMHYVCNLIKSNISLIDETKVERIDCVVDIAHAWNLILIRPSGLILVDGISTKEDIDKKAAAIMKKGFKGTIDELKIADLRVWGRFVMGAQGTKGATKTVLIDKLKEWLS